MSPLSRLALALTVFAAACERSPAAPQPFNDGAGGSALAPLSAPTNLRASFLGASGVVVLDWDYSAADAIRAAGFLVERADDLDGPWSIKGFTTAATMGDYLGTDQRYCYRVAAVTSSADQNSLPSRPLCVTAP